MERWKRLFNKYKKYTEPQLNERLIELDEEMCIIKNMQEIYRFKRERKEYWAKRENTLLSNIKSPS